MSSNLISNAEANIRTFNGHDRLRKLMGIQLATQKNQIIYYSDAWRVEICKIHVIINDLAKGIYLLISGTNLDRKAVRKLYNDSVKIVHDHDVANSCIYSAADSVGVYYSVKGLARKANQVAEAVMEDAWLSVPTFAIGVLLGIYVEKA